MSKMPYHPPRWTSLDPLDAKSKLERTAWAGGERRDAEAGGSVSAAATFSRS